MNDPRWNRIVPRTLADQVYQDLRGRILSGDLGPGVFIRERDLSDALGVSRTPVRDALGRLASEGFLERLPHRGFRIPEESVVDLLELYPILTALEIWAGRESFPRLDAEDLLALEQLNRDCLETIRDGDSRGAIEANHEFHRRLSSRCRNRHLLALLDDLRSKVVRMEYWSVSHPGQTLEAVQQHKEILRAISARDYARAFAVLEQNRMQTYHAYLGGPDDSIEGYLPSTA